MTNEEGSPHVMVRNGYDSSNVIARSGEHSWLVIAWKGEESEHVTGISKEDPWLVITWKGEDFWLVIASPEGAKQSHKKL
jgi:hypothetical protein